MNECDECIKSNVYNFNIQDCFYNDWNNNLDLTTAEAGLSWYENYYSILDLNFSNDELFTSMILSAPCCFN